MSSPAPTRLDRAWLAGYQAGRTERFWHGIRRLWWPSVVVGWLYLAVGRRTPDLVRVLAIFGVLAALWLTIVLSPLEVAWLVHRWWQRRSKREPLFSREDETLPRRNGGRR